MGKLTGRIFNIQKFSVHDGPGVRDTIFMKGCPLRCTWCSNPESQRHGLQLGWREKKCVGCGVCLKTCENGALGRAENGAIVRAPEKCSKCLVCVKRCYAKAMHVYGEDVTVDELYGRIRNKPQAWRVDGGVTVSGGEPLMQADFVGELLAKFRRYGIHTAIETTLCASFNKVAKVAAHCSLIYADMKLADPVAHKRHTGVDNSLIKANFLRLKKEFPEVQLIARTPVIPGVNDNEAELGAIADFLKTVPGLDDYELLPFHGFAQPKYHQLGLDYQFKDIPNMDKESVVRKNAALKERIGLKL